MMFVAWVGTQKRERLKDERRVRNRAKTVELPISCVSEKGVYSPKKYFPPNQLVMMMSVLSLYSAFFIYCNIFHTVILLYAR